MFLSRLWKKKKEGLVHAMQSNGPQSKFKYTLLRKDHPPVHPLTSTTTVHAHGLCTNLKRIAAMPTRFVLEVDGVQYAGDLEDNRKTSMVSRINDNFSLTSF
jgi:hypothetical protein